MNRELKLRIRLKNKETGEVLVMNNSVFDTMNGIAWFEIDRKMFELLSFDQYTGLKDKNGKEIFEGDLYTTNKSKTLYQVLFISGAFCGGISEDTSEPLGWDYNGEDMYDITPISSDWIEVIGNIHQNPELLKTEI